jgi:hypothetical protein
LQKVHRISADLQARIQRTYSDLAVFLGSHRHISLSEEERFQSLVVSYKKVEEKRKHLPPEDNREAP